MVWANAPDAIPAPSEVILLKLTKMFPGALPSAILQEDYNTIIRLMETDSAEKEVHAFKRKLRAS